MDTGSSGLPASMQLVTPQEFKSEFLLPELMQQENRLPPLPANYHSLSDTDKQRVQQQRSRDKLNPYVVLMREYDREYMQHLGLPIEAMARNRDITPQTENFALTMGARLQGFTLQESFYLRITDSVLRHMLPSLPQYVDTNSGNNWGAFLGLLLDGKLRVEQLWTKDYVNFTGSPQGPTIIDGGPWFKSTHVSVQLSYIGYRNVLAQLGSSFTSELAHQILEDYMPVNLVLERMGFYVGMSLNVYISGHVIGGRKHLLVYPDTDPELYPYGRLTAS